MEGRSLSGVVSPTQMRHPCCATSISVLRGVVLCFWWLETEANIIDKVPPAHDVVHHEAVEEEPRLLSSATAGRG